MNRGRGVGDGAQRHGGVRRRARPARGLGDEQRPAEGVGDEHGPVAGATGNDEGPGIDASSPTDHAAGGLHRSQEPPCATKIENLRPILHHGNLYRTVAVAFQRSLLACPLIAAAPSDIEACAQSTPAETCDQLFSNNEPAACNYVGPMPQGGACSQNAQCDTRTEFCEGDPGQTCGVCAPRVGAMGACSDDSVCQLGLSCAIPSGDTLGTCAVPAAAGEECDDNSRAQGPSSARKMASAGWRSRSAQPARARSATSPRVSSAIPSSRSARSTRRLRPVTRVASARHPASVEPTPTWGPEPASPRPPTARRATRPTAPCARRPPRAPTAYASCRSRRSATDAGRLEARVTPRVRSPDGSTSPAGRRPSRRAHVAPVQVGAGREALLDPHRDVVEKRVGDRRRQQRERERQRLPSHHDAGGGAVHPGADAARGDERDHPRYEGQGRHQDRAKSVAVGLEDGVEPRPALGAQMVCVIRPGGWRSSSRRRRAR